MAFIHVWVVGLLCLTVTLSISTWLLSSVISGYVVSAYGVDESAASLLTVAAQAGFMISAAFQAVMMLPALNARSFVRGTR